MSMRFECKADHVCIEGKCACKCECDTTRPCTEGKPFLCSVCAVREMRDTEWGEDGESAHGFPALAGSK